MYNNLVVNPRLGPLNYFSYFPFRPLNKFFRSSSLRGTKIYKPQNSFPYLRFQPNVGFAAKYSKGTTYLKSAKCPKGKPDLNGFLNQKQSTVTAPLGEEDISFATAGRVEPQLNGFLNQRQSALTTRASEPNPFLMPSPLCWLLNRAPIMRIPEHGGQ